MFSPYKRVNSEAVGGPDSLTELVFLMVILKIPIVYLCLVVYKAIKAEPHRPEPEPAVVRARRPRRRPPRPHGGPVRASARTVQARADRVGRG